MWRVHVDLTRNQINFAEKEISYKYRWNFNLNGKNKLKIIKYNNFRPIVSLSLLFSFCSLFFFCYCSHDDAKMTSFNQVRQNPTNCYQKSNCFTLKS